MHRLLLRSQHVLSVFDLNDIIPLRGLNKEIGPPLAMNAAPLGFKKPRCNTLDFIQESPAPSKWQYRYLADFVTPEGRKGAYLPRPASFLPQPRSYAG